MARIIAAPQVSASLAEFASLAEVESRFQLSRSEDPDSFSEWQQAARKSAEDADSLA